MRVLFTTCPAYGHALPMVPLMRAAQAAGADVRVATGPDLLAPLRDRGFDARPAGPPWAQMWAAHDEVWADPRVEADAKHIAGVVSLFGTPAAARLADLTALAEAWRPDLVVHEVLEVAAPILASRLGVPAVVHGFGPMFPFYGVLAAPAGAAAGEPDLWASLSRERYLDVCPPALRPDGPPAWADATPLRPSPGERGPVPPHVADVLRDEGRPVAYFTLGTVKNKESEELAAGLEALADFDGHVVATTGRAFDPAELGAVPDNVVLAEFVPQASLLPHVDLLVSHAGAGTLLGGLHHGIAQVAAPRGTDQPENAALLARAGAGVVVPLEDYGAETLRAAIAEVTGDPAYADNARRVQKEIEAMPSPAQVWASLSA